MDDSAKKFKTLSAREREALDLLCQGLAQKGIALKMGIKVDGVKSHVSHIYQKLELMHLPPRERGFILRDVYWPLHKAEPINAQDPEPEIEVFDPIPPEFDDILEQDENIIRALVAVENPTPVGRRRGATLPCSVLAVVGLIVLGTILFFTLDGIRFAQGLFATATPTYTFTPSKTATFTASITATNTLTSTPSRTPSRTPTETLTPSPTWTQTPRPSPTVDLGDVYELGEWHTEDGMAFRLVRYEIESGPEPNILFLVEVWNQTNQDIHFSWGPLSNSWVIDNLGIRHNEEIFNSFQNETVPAQGKILLQINVTSWTTFIDAEFVFQPEITEIYYTLDSLSRLDRASWRIPIGK